MAEDQETRTEATAVKSSSKYELIMVEQRQSYTARRRLKMSTVDRVRTVVDWKATVERTLAANGEVWMPVKSAAGMRALIALAKREKLALIGKERPFVGEGSYVGYGKTGNRSSGRRNLGRSWESYQGKRTVVGTHQGTGMWMVQMEGDTSGRLELFNTEQLESEIAFDAKQLARHKALAPEREARAKANAARAAQEAAEEADEANTWGFADQFPPMKRARVIKALNVTLRFNGRFNRRKDEIYRRVTQEGWRTAQTKHWGRVLQGPDESFLVQKDLTKTGLEFADYLSARGQRRRRR